MVWALGPKRRRKRNRGRNEPGCSRTGSSRAIGNPDQFAPASSGLTVYWAKGFDDIYILTRGIDVSSLRLQAEEVRGVRLASWEEVLETIREGIFIPCEESFIDLLFRLREHRDIHTREDDGSAIFHRTE